MSRARSLKSGILLIAISMLAAWIATAQQPRRVDDTLLKTGSKTGDEWVAYGVNWSEQRYSPLKQINDSNVGRLGLAWSYDIPLAPGNPQTHQEGTPLVFNGVLYSITPWSIVYAVDLRTGKEIWRADPEVNQQVWQSRICCGVVNRGIAMYEGKIIAPVVDGRLRALDAATGRILWETRVSPENHAVHHHHGAPRHQGRQDHHRRERRRVCRSRILFRLRCEDREDWLALLHGAGRSLQAVRASRAGGCRQDLDQRLVEDRRRRRSLERHGLRCRATTSCMSAQASPVRGPTYHRGPGDNLYSCSILAVRGVDRENGLVLPGSPRRRLGLRFDRGPDAGRFDDQRKAPRKVIMHAPKDAFFYVHRPPDGRSDLGRSDHESIVDHGHGREGPSDRESGGAL